MADLIEREWVLKRMVLAPDADVVRMAPEVDAVPVMRCKDCVNYRIGNNKDNFGYCEHICNFVPEYFFCAHCEVKCNATN